LSQLVHPVIFRTSVPRLQSPPRTSSSRRAPLGFLAVWRASESAKTKDLCLSWAALAFSIFRVGCSFADVCGHGAHSGRRRNGECIPARSARVVQSRVAWTGNPAGATVYCACGGGEREGTLWKK